MKDDFNPLILNKWLRGDAAEEELKEWLKSIYPDDMHDDILSVLDEDDSSPISEEKIDDIIESMPLHHEETKEREKRR